MTLSWTHKEGDRVSAPLSLATGPSGEHYVISHRWEMRLQDAYVTDGTVHYRGRFNVTSFSATRQHVGTYRSLAGAQRAAEKHVLGLSCTCPLWTRDPACPLYDAADAAVEPTTDPRVPVEETAAPEVRLEDLRYGWRLWCRLGDIDECANTDQRRGFRLAAEANDRGGNRPTVAEARHLDLNDLQEIN